MKNENFNFKYGLPPKADLTNLNYIISAAKQSMTEISKMNYNFSWSKSKINTEKEIDHLAAADKLIELSKEKLIDWLHKATNFNFVYKPQEILLTDGCTEGIEMLMKLLFKPNASIILETPSYHKFVRFFQEVNYKIFPVDRNEKTGLFEISEIEKILNLNKIDFMYIVPTCSNPAAKTLNIVQKNQLVELAGKYDFYLVCDDIYQFFTVEVVRKLNFSNEKIIPISFCDSSNISLLTNLNNKKKLKLKLSSKNVIAVNSFNKLFNLNGFRVGYLHAHKDIISTLTKHINYEQPTLLQVFKYNTFKYFIENLNLVLNYTVNQLSLKKTKANDILKFNKSMIKGKLVELYSYEIPTSGFFLWLKLCDEINLEKLKRLLELNNIQLLFGESFTSKVALEEDRFKYLYRRIRLSFGTLPLDKLLRGLSKLKIIFEQCCLEDTKF